MYLWQAPGDTNGAGEQQGLSREAAPMLPPTPSRQSPPPALPTVSHPSQSTPPLHELAQEPVRNQTKVMDAPTRHLVF